MRVLLAKEMRALDRAAEEEIGIPGIVLMENAGRAVADAAEQMLGSCRGKTIVIFAGKSFLLQRQQDRKVSFFQQTYGQDRRIFCLPHSVFFRYFRRRIRSVLLVHRPAPVCG